MITSSVKTPSSDALSCVKRTSETFFIQVFVLSNFIHSFRSLLFLQVPLNSIEFFLKLNSPSLLESFFSRGSMFILSRRIPSRRLAQSWSEYQDVRELCNIPLLSRNCFFSSTCFFKVSKR